MRVLLILMLLSISIESLSQDFLISNLQQRDVWINMENPLFVIVDSLSCGSYFLSTNNGIIKNSDDGFIGYSCKKGAYFIKPTMLGRAIVDIKTIKNGDTIVIGQKIFSVKDFGDLIGYVGDKKDDSIKSNDLAAQWGVQAGIDYSNFPFDLDINFKVVNYSIVIIQNGRSNLTMDLEGNKFPKDLNQKFSSLNPNDKVLFYGIDAIGPDGIKRKVQNIELIIK